ncbi:hypothetical protein JL720_2780 [Aureococcus anophagefferens]|nr:hypothetical protein JL720_2780 [Aureococcus anophagefferens]
MRRLLLVAAALLGAHTHKHAAHIAPIDVPETAARFVVITQPRSGSTWFVKYSRLFAQCPGVVTAGEVLHPETLAEAAPRILGRGGAAAPSTTPVRAVGFKLMYAQLPLHGPGAPVAESGMLRNVTLKGFLKYAAQSKIAVVHLARQNRHLQHFLDASCDKFGATCVTVAHEHLVGDGAPAYFRAVRNAIGLGRCARFDVDAAAPAAPATTTTSRRSATAASTTRRRTMSTPGEYQWKETAEKVIVRINLRGCSAKSVDVYAADVYAKVSYPPRLVELDLINEVDEDGAVAKIKDGHLTLSLPKKQPGETWGALEIGERAKDRKQEDDRTALRKQMKLDETERCTVEEKKATEKSRAEEDMYEAFKEMKVKEAKLKAEAEQAKLLEEEEEEEEEEEKVREVGDDGGFDLGGAAEEPAPPPKVPAASSNAENAPAAENVAPKKKSRKARKKAAAAVRGGGTSVVNVSHTPRVFPTPMRESKLRDENEWISKNRTHLHKNKMLFGKSIVGTDGRGIEECDPTWLKSRATTSTRRATTERRERLLGGPRARPDQHACRANRAACYLRLERHADCVADCAKALEGDVAAKLRTKILARRGAARCGLGAYAAAAADFGDAAALADAASLGQQQLRDDAARARRWRPRGRQGRGRRRSSAATRRAPRRPTAPRSTSSRTSSPRSRTARPRGLRATTRPAPSRTARGAGPLRGRGRRRARRRARAPAGSDKRRAWVLRTLARRGAALAALGELRGRRRLRDGRGHRAGRRKLASDLHALKAKADAAEASPPPPPAEADAALD